MRQQVAEAYGMTCHLCGQSIPSDLPRYHPLGFEADHIKPAMTYPNLAWDLSNLRPSHKRCNRTRGMWDLTPRLVAEITAQYAA